MHSSPQRLAIRLAIVGSVLSGCSCGDRNIVEAGSSDGQVSTEAEALCAEISEWQVRCLAANGYPNELSKDERHAACMAAWFPTELEGACYDEAVHGAKCEFTQSCENFPYTASSPWPCQDDALPYTECKRDTEYWTANNCDVSKCPGECCPGAD